MPAAATVCRWLGQNEDFRQQYAHARDAQADTLADETLFIADAATDAGLGRLRLDARKWYASKLAPKRYGDKLDIEQSGQVTVNIVRHGVDKPAQ